MKRILVVFVVLMSATFLAGCNAQDQLTQKAKETAQQEVAKQKNEIKNKIDEKVGEINEKKQKVADFVNAGKPQKCTFTDLDKSSDYSGTIYTDGRGKMYAEFKGEVDDSGKQVEMRTIKTKDKMYTWSPDNKKGMSMSVKDEDKSDDDYGDANNADNPRDYLNEVMENYNCKVWVVNPAKFTPPSDVNFMDMDEMVKKTRNSMANVCNKLEGEAKENCLKQIPAGN